MNLIRQKNNKSILMASLAEILKTRKSVRIFTIDFPDKEIINKIAESAVYAPYSRATGLPYEEIRKIYVFAQGTETFEEVRAQLKIEIKRISNKVNRLIAVLPFLRKKYKFIADRFKALSKNSIPSLTTAPYFIIIAEKKGFPPVAGQSAAHAMQNMWLSATDAGLGFQLIKEFSLLSENKKFCDLLGIESGKFHIDGCAIGVPANKDFKPKTFSTNNFITWL